MTLAIGWLHDGGDTVETWLHQAGDWHATANSAAMSAAAGSPAPNKADELLEFASPRFDLAPRLHTNADSRNSYAHGAADHVPSHPSTPSATAPEPTHRHTPHSTSPRRPTKLVALNVERAHAFEPYLPPFFRRAGAAAAKPLARLGSPPRRPTRSARPLLRGPPKTASSLTICGTLPRSPAGTNVGRGRARLARARPDRRAPLAAVREARRRAGRGSRRRPWPHAR